jgi:hypothetical protein
VTYFRELGKTWKVRGKRVTGTKIPFINTGLRPTNNVRPTTIKTFKLFKIFNI